MLEVNDLSVFFHTRNGLVKAVNDISFNLKEDETLAIVGESGSGKSMICHTIMGLLTCPPANIESGSIYLAGEEILKSSKKRMRQLRSNNIAMIFASTSPLDNSGWNENIGIHHLNVPNPTVRFSRLKRHVIY